MTKVGKSDGEGTFTGMRGNDKVAPIPVVRITAAPNHFDPRGPSLPREIWAAVTPIMVAAVSVVVGCWSLFGRLTASLFRRAPGVDEW